ncbi:MAG: hypothetical protein WDW36_005763 [Sanguina aurantia]
MSQAGANSGYGLFLSGSSSSSNKTALSSSPPAEGTQPASPSLSWWGSLARNASKLVFREGRSKAGGASSDEGAVLVRIPLRAALTAENIMASEVQMRSLYSWMLDAHMCNERTLIMVALVFERLRGPESRMAPYIDLLPTSFDTPLHFTKAELEELRGTNLANASSTVYRNLQEQWDRLGPAMITAAKHAGLERAPTFDDLLWAFSVYWSRGLSLPIPEEGAASMVLALQPEKLSVQEGLMPGLDLCNHDPAAPCWWEVIAPPRNASQLSPAAIDAAMGIASEAALAGKDGMAAASDAIHLMEAGGPRESQVLLRLHQGASLSASKELTISYGSKSNEELLLLYGFATQDNPHDALMMVCPLPPKNQWDNVMFARVELLQAYGLTPQFFLQHPDAVRAAAQRGGSSPASASTSQGGALVLPPGVLDTLEVFVLNYKELSQRMRLLRQQENRPDVSTGEDPGTVLPVSVSTLPQHSPVLDIDLLETQAVSMNGRQLGQLLDDLGMRLATLTTLERLLAVKSAEIEDTETGTGSLERDEGLLSLGQASVPPRVWACLVYRVGQKRLIRTYITLVREELQKLMVLLRKVELMYKAAEKQ